MQMRARLLFQVVLGIVRIVRVPHPQEVRSIEQPVLWEPCASTLLLAPVEVTLYRVCVLDALTLFDCLHPLDGEALGLNADTPQILHEDHGQEGPENQERR